MEKLTKPILAQGEWEPVNDGYGIIGYHWNCDCCTKTTFVSNGDSCSNCNILLPPDPDWEFLNKKEIK